MKQEPGNSNAAIFVILMVLFLVSSALITYGLINFKRSETKDASSGLIMKNEVRKDDKPLTDYFADKNRPENSADGKSNQQYNPFEETCAGISGKSPAISYGTVCMQ